MAAMTGMGCGIDTVDPEEAHDWLRSTYAEHAVRLSGSREDFRFRHELADCGPFVLGTAQHSMTCHGVWEPLDDTVLFCHLLSGRFHARSVRAAVVAAPGEVFGYDPDARTTVTWTDIRLTNVRIRRAALDRVAAGLYGADRAAADRPAGPVGFDLARPVGGPAARHWKRLLEYVTADVVGSPEVSGNPIIMGQLARTVIATALQTFPNTTLDRLRCTALPAAPGSVRRAIAYIEEHAQEDIDLTDIAEAADVGPRALQRGFRRAADTTPLGYLRLVRLERAHEQLVTADGEDGTTVVAVAARWGFGHPGRFAGSYRARFGRSPGETLRG
jgi:AraC-like DNA-binding protein